MPAMARMTRGEFLGLSAALAGGFRVGSRASETSPAAAQTASSTITTEPDLIVVNARVYTIDAPLRAPKRSPSRTAVSSPSARPPTCGISRRRARGSSTPAGDGHARASSTRTATSAASTSSTASTPTSAACASCWPILRRRPTRRRPGMWVTAVMFDDTKLDVPLTRRHLDEVSKDHPIVVESSRRAHELVQHEGLRARWRHQEHARSGSRPILPRRERRADRPRRRARAQRVQQGRHARDVHARAAARARRATACATSRSC